MARTSRRSPSFRLVTASTAAAALLLAGCGDADDQEVDPAPAADLEPDEEPTGAEQPDQPADTADGAEADIDRGGVAAEGPTPDPDLVDEPCGPDVGREGEAFISVVAPVADQLVSGDSVELVGCSNVYEATVHWSLYDRDGEEVATGFTTAECGNGCVGAFADEVPLDAVDGETVAELHVYSEDPSGGESGEADEDGRLHRVAIPLVLG